MLLATFAIEPCISLAAIDVLRDSMLLLVIENCEACRDIVSGAGTGPSLYVAAIFIFAFYYSEKPKPDIYHQHTQHWLFALRIGSSLTKASVIIG